MEIGVHQHRQFQVHPWNRAKKQRMKASQYFVTLDLIPRNARQKCHRTHNLLVLRSLQFSFTLGPQSSCGHKSVLACFSPIQAKCWQHNLHWPGDCQVCQTCSTNPAIISSCALCGMCYTLHIKMPAPSSTHLPMALYYNVHFLN